MISVRINPRDQSCRLIAGIHSHTPGLYPHNFAENGIISIYVLDLCIIKGNKVKFQEKLLFREPSRKSNFS